MSAEEKRWQLSCEDLTVQIYLLFFLCRDLSNNAIMSIQANAFSQMKNLQEL